MSGTTSPFFVLLSGLLLVSCSSLAEPELEDAPSSVCKLHSNELAVVLVPAEHGPLNAERVPGYQEARLSLFPNAVIPKLNGELHELTLEKHCRDCTYAEMRWLWAEFEGVMSSEDALLPTFYELVPSSQSLGMADLASCDIHTTNLEVVLSPSGYGCGIPIPGYREAEVRLFPNAMTPKNRGGVHEIGLVAHCPDCTIAERRWVEQQLGPASFHPYYEVPPNMRLQRTPLRGAAEPLSR